MHQPAKKHQFRLQSRVQPKHLPKPPFVSLIERNFLLSKTNQAYQFPRLDSNSEETDSEDMELYGVYNLFHQAQPKHRLQYSTIEMRSGDRQKTQASQILRKELNLSEQRVKTEISEENPKIGQIRIKLPQIPGKKTQLASILQQARSISQTSIK